jgi:hypothetical protein
VEVVLPETNGVPNWHPDTVRTEWVVPVTADADVSWAPRGVKRMKWTAPLPCWVPVALPKLVVNVKGPVPGDVKMNSHACCPGGTVTSRFSALSQNPFVVPLPVQVTVPSTTMDEEFCGASAAPEVLGAPFGGATEAEVEVGPPAPVVPVAFGAAVEAGSPGGTGGVVVVVVVPVGVALCPLAEPVLPVLPVVPVLPVLPLVTASPVPVAAGLAVVVAAVACGAAVAGGPATATKVALVPMTAARATASE